MAVIEKKGSPFLIYILKYKILDETENKKTKNLEFFTTKTNYDPIEMQYASDL